jgi:hypothetical protein
MANGIGIPSVARTEGNRSLYRAERSTNAPGRESFPREVLWVPRSERSVRIIGAGGYVPPHTVTARDMARAIPGWTPEQIVEKTGILERRFLWPLDPELGRAVPVPESAREQPATGVDMGEAALTKALKMAGMPAPAPAPAPAPPPEDVASRPPVRHYPPIE